MRETPAHVPPIGIAIALLYLFRDPQRDIPPVPLGIVSPVDGQVVAAGEEVDPFLGRPAIKLAIRMQSLGPWTLRSAMEGRVMQQWYLPEGLDEQSTAGTGGAIKSVDSRARQARFAMWIQSDEQDDVVIAMRGGFITRRLRCAVRTGDRIGQGQRWGILVFGAAANVYVPANSRTDASQGDTVRAGSDIIATLIHKELPTAATLTGQ